MKTPNSLLKKAGAASLMAALIMTGGSWATADKAVSSEAEPASAQPVGTSAPETSTPPPREDRQVSEEKTVKPAVLELSPGMGEIVELARSGASAEVMLAFIERSGKTYTPGVQEIIYLQDLGVAPLVIAELIRSGDPDSQLADQVEQQGTAERLAAESEPATQSAVEPQPASYAAAPQPTGQTVTSGFQEPNVNLSESYYVESLSPYGEWLYIEGYGRVFRPSIATINSGWRPYSDGGRWIYTDYGWYWLSDYSWGWACFHYGRWLNHGGHGWVWVPGYKWAPAWVSWRSSASYCGWAPLPPVGYGGVSVGIGYVGSSWNVGVSIGYSSYTWVPWRYCYGYYPSYYRAPVSVTREVYNNSTVIKPTIIGDNNTIIINGPDVTQVQAATRTRIKTVNIRDAGSTTRSVSREHLDQGGATLTAFRPGYTEPKLNSEEREKLASRVAPARSTVRSIPRPEVSTVNSQTDRTMPSRTPTLRPAPAGSSTITSTSRISSRTAEQQVGTTTRSTARSSEYPTPAREPVPILRNGRKVNVTTASQVSRPVVAGGLRTQTTRTTPTTSDTTTSFWQNRTPVTRSERQTVNTTSSFRNPNTTSRVQQSPSTPQNYRDRLEQTRSTQPTYRPPVQLNTRDSRTTVRSVPSPSYRAPSVSTPRAPSRSSAPAIRSQPSPSQRSISSPPTRSAPSPSLRSPSRTTPSSSSTPARSSRPAPTRSER